MTYWTTGQELPCILSPVISAVHCCMVSSTSPTLSSVNGGDYASQVNVHVILIFITIFSLVHCFNVLARPTCAFTDPGGRAGPDSVVALGKTLHTMTHYALPPNDNTDLTFILRPVLSHFRASDFY